MTSAHEAAGRADPTRTARTVDDDVRQARRRLEIDSFARLAGTSVAWPLSILPLIAFSWDDADNARLLSGVIAATCLFAALSGVAALLAVRTMRRGPLTPRQAFRSQLLTCTMLVPAGAGLALLPVAMQSGTDPTNVFIGQTWTITTLTLFTLTVNPPTRPFLALSVTTLSLNTLAMAFLDLGFPALFVALAPFSFIALAIGQHRQYDQTLRALTGEIASTRLAAEVGSANERLEAVNDELQHRATHDPLTGLINRPTFVETADLALRLATDQGRLCALMIIDVDRFKTVNDALGHAAGDEVLVQIAARMQATLPESALAARHGGDAFAVLLPDVPDESAGRRTGDRLRVDLGRPWRVDGQWITGSVSVGLAFNSDPSDAAGDLLRHADAALYRVKGTGRDHVEVFDQTLRHSLRRRISDETELRDALAAGQIVAWFQPVVDMRDGSVTGAEALARWIHPEHGVLPPGRFLPLLEDAGLLPALGREMAAQAFALRRTIRPLVPRDFRVAINLGVRDQAVSTIVGRLVEQADRAGVDPVGIALEITETAVINDIAGAATAVAEARRHGFTVALDDFGTGYSSLALLSDLELDTLKIDRSFVSRMMRRPADAAIIASILDLARRLDLDVIAEGVESCDEVDRLLEEGAVYAQGFRYSPAVCPEEFLALLRSTPPWVRLAAGHQVVH